MIQDTARISDDEKIRRRAAIDFARGSSRFEGIVLPEEVEEINRQFINGDISGDEHVAAIRAFALGK